MIRLSQSFYYTMDLSTKTLSLFFLLA